MQTLIDLARAKVHSDAELCRRIGIKPPNLVEIRQGKRAVSAELAAALCDVLELSGDECREWVAVSMIENPKNAKCADRLRRALFACWVLGVGLQLAPNDAQATSAGYTAPVDGIYIVAHRARQSALAILLFFRWLVQPALSRAPALRAGSPLALGGLRPPAAQLATVRHLPPARWTAGAWWTAHPA